MGGGFIFGNILQTFLVLVSLWFAIGCVFKGQECRGMDIVCLRM